MARTGAVSRICCKGDRSQGAATCVELSALYPCPAGALHGRLGLSLSEVSRFLILL